ncbi:MAG: N-6 DNA methylase [Pyrinomonadaceae bacterium]
MPDDCRRSARINGTRSGNQRNLSREMRDLFLEIARSEINPEITPEDIREMIIQHVLTEDIFTNVFDDAEFHRSNNIARELENVIDTFMTREVRKNYLSRIEYFYKTIRDAASGITDNHEKQKFLKTVYENFYKVYNPKGADKLGVVYTPNEIVRFMIDSTDWLLEKHFGKSLSDKGVDILDPATGTGTFIAELIDRINIHNARIQIRTRAARQRSRHPAVLHRQSQYRIHLSAKKRHV